MMVLYVVAVAIHVVVAVLAVGVVGAIPVTARIARMSAAGFEGSQRALGVLLRILQIGLAVMLLTGVLLDLSMAGAFHRTGWLKASVVVLVGVGFSHARARAALRGALTAGGDREGALTRVERWGWAMCAAVALITILMQTKLLP
jgi:hypothetical protein